MPREIRQHRPLGLLKPAKPIHIVPPAYPATAKAVGIEGVVRLRVTIAKDGTVKDFQVISGDTALVPAAVEAVRQWRYEPLTLEGKPVESLATTDVVFRLRGR